MTSDRTDKSLLWTSPIPLQSYEMNYLKHLKDFYKTKIAIPWTTKDNLDPS